MKFVKPVILSLIIFPIVRLGAYKLINFNAPINDFILIETLVETLFFTIFFNIALWYFIRKDEKKSGEEV